MLSLLLWFLATFSIGRFVEILPVVDSFSFHTVAFVGSNKNAAPWLLMRMAKKNKSSSKTTSPGVGAGGPSSESNSDWESLPAEVLTDEGDDDDDDDEDWIPDRYKNRPTPYTDDEEAVIEAMGGKQKTARTYSREPGYLGDSTLEDICTDYSVPICYLADVLCTWGAPIPINPQSLLGDLVTGEQAFAILEAINSLDVAALHDRYSDVTLQQLCYEWDINLNDAFAMAMKEGWNLPFGVQTFLRVDQERELLRVLVDPDSIKIEPNRGDPYEDDTIYFEQNA
jgi:hypothetical protein